MGEARISEVRLILIRMPLERPMPGPFGTMAARHNLVVTIEAGGVRGLGEIWANFPPWGPYERVAIFENVVKPMLTGEMLDDPGRLYGALVKRLRPLGNQWGAPGPVNQVLAGVDGALWDAKARLEKVRLAELLSANGAANAVPVYGSNIMPQHLEEDIEKARAAGHIRFKVRLSFGLETDRRTLSVGREAVRDAPLMCDASQSYTPDMVAKLQPELAKASLDWFEEPYLVDDTASYLGWRRQAGVPPLAMGENSYGKAGFEQLMSTITPDVVQPDITKTAGVTDGLEIGRRVVASGKRLCFHMFGGPVGLHASAHLAAAIPGASWVEMDANPNPLYQTVLDRVPRVVDGALQLDPRPGLGIELNEKELQPYLIDTRARA